MDRRFDSNSTKSPDASGSYLVLQENQCGKTLSVTKNLQEF